MFRQFHVFPSQPEYFPSIFVLISVLLSFVGICTFFFAQGFHDWQKVHGYKITLEMPSSLTQQQKDQAVKFLKSWPQVKKVSEISKQSLQSFVVNWTGIENSYLPVLIDVELPLQQIDPLLNQFKKITPNVVVHQHDVWLKKLIKVGKEFECAALSVGGFLTICLIFIVALLTQSLLQNYESTLDILRLMGAQNRYIATLFQSYVVKFSLKNGIISFSLALPLCHGFVFWLSWWGIDLWKDAFFPILMILISIPCLVTLLSLIISRFVVLLRLRKLDAC